MELQHLTHPLDCRKYLAQKLQATWFWNNSLFLPSRSKTNPCERKRKPSETSEDEYALGLVGKRRRVCFGTAKTEDEYALGPKKLKTSMLWDGLTPTHEDEYASGQGGAREKKRKPPETSEDAYALGTPKKQNMRRHVWFGKPLYNYE